MNDIPCRRISLAGSAVAVVFAALLPTVVTAVYFVALADCATWLQQIAWAVGKTLQFGFPAFWVVRVQREPLQLMPGQTRRGWEAGAISGALISLAILALYHLWLAPAGIFDGSVAAMRAKLAGMGLDSPGRYIAFGVFLSVAHSGLEEYYFRWFLFGQMRRLTPFGAATILSSAAFAAHHVLVLAVYFGWTSPWTWLCVAGVAVGGVIWAWMYERTGSLFGPWLSHLLVDATILFIGYDLLLM